MVFDILTSILVNISVHDISPYFYVIAAHPLVLIRLTGQTEILFRSHHNCTNSYQFKKLFEVHTLLKDVTIINNIVPSYVLMLHLLMLYKMRGFWCNIICHYFIIGLTSLGCFYLLEVDNSYIAWKCLRLC